MAIIEYQFQKATWTQIIKCARWALNVLQMRDWQISIKDHDLKEEKLGYADFNINTLHGLIFIDINYCKKENQNPFAVILHEILHLFIAYKTQSDEISDEPAVRALEPILYEKFCKNNKVKQMKVRKQY